MKYLIENFKNNIDFFLRQRLNLSRKNYFEKNEDKEGLFASQKALEREKFLFEKYSLKELKNNSTRQNYLENLYTLDILDKYLVSYLAPHPIPPPQGGRGNTNTKPPSSRILDIGCKNWFYAKGEYFFFKKYSPQLELKGVELDSKRLYSNFFNRAEVAKFYIKGLENAHYIEGDFLNLKGNFDYLIWILPFVVKEPLLKWGLPTKYFCPEKMLAHAISILNPNGKIFIINQGESEYNIQKNLCEKLNIKPQELGEIKSDFEIFTQHKRYGLIIES